MPGSGLSRQTRVGLWGYSEGGAASLWAAQPAAGYAPELNVVGDASGGIPGDLKEVAAGLDGSAFSGFLADAATNIQAAYPTLPFDSLLNDQGREAVKTAKSVCLAGTLTALAGKSIKDFTTAGLTLDQLYHLPGRSCSTAGPSTKSSPPPPRTPSAPPTAPRACEPAGRSTPATISSPTTRPSATSSPGSATGSRAGLPGVTADPLRRWGRPVSHRAPPSS
ncbi:hypothetical protein QFZ32_006659 [Streptomyces canus]|nr:hypothetical protein [Streptomyces canus]